MLRILVTANVEGFPLQHRLNLNAFLQGCFGGQDCRVDLSFIKQQVQECALGIGKWQHCVQSCFTLLYKLRSELLQRRLLSLPG